MEDRFSALTKEMDQQMRDVQVRTTEPHALVAVEWCKRCRRCAHVTQPPQGDVDLQTSAVVQADSAAVTHALEDRLEAAHCQLATMQARAEAAEARCAAAEASVASALADRTFLKMVHTFTRRHNAP